MTVPVLLITGPVGVGKTSVLIEIQEVLRTTGTRFASVDLDALSYWFPVPARDPFRMTLVNLAAVWRTFRAAGAERLVLATVVESRRELVRYRKAIPGAGIVVVRLRAPIRTLQRRVRARDIGLGRSWGVGRAAELARIMDRERVEDVNVETDERSVNSISREIFGSVGWQPARRITRRAAAPSRRSGG